MFAWSTNREHKLKFFFTELGLSVEGRYDIKGEWAGRFTGLGSQQVEVVMMVTPDGHSRLEIIN